MDTMTEHQIKGCQTLAEVEGLEQIIPGDVTYFRNKERERRNRNYLHDWNDLHRVWDIIFSKVIDMKPIRQPLYGKLLGMSFHESKEQTFNALVEAAEWIKQQEK